MTHFYDKRPKTIQPEREEYVRVWCGREVRRNQATSGLTSVECQRCRAAFSKVLQALPDVDDHTPIR